MEGALTSYPAVRTLENAIRKELGGVKIKEDESLDMYTTKTRRIIRKRQDRSIHETILLQRLKNRGEIIICLNQ